MQIKSRKKRSPIWSITKEEMQVLLYEKNTYSDVMRHFNLNPVNGSIKTLYKRIRDENLDDSVLRSKMFTVNNNKNKKTNSEIFCENSFYSRGHLKKRIISENIIKYSCRDCSNCGEWNNKKIILHIEHINGINTDNRLENLCFLCPNCHSQTNTYAGKNKKRSLVIKKTKQKIARQTKIKWPDPETIQKLLWEMPTIEVAKILGVSDKAVEKFCKKNKLTKPTRGFWSKKWR